MQITSKDFKIQNIFSRREYTIPDYQRDYSWTVDEEISTFWEDFTYYLSKGPKTNFFIGPMVFKGKDINSFELEVVDGQQRLITFSILISVLVSLFKEYGREGLSDGLKQYLIFKDEQNKDRLVIKTIEPHPFFQSKIFHNVDASPLKPSEKLIEEARLFFNKQIQSILSTFNTNDKKITFLEKIRSYVFNIDTVIIVSDDETDAFTIFETINTRGKDLSSLDLLKNYVFKNHPILTGVDEPKGVWKKIVDNTKVSRETFFNRFWASHVFKVTENKLYRRFSDYIRDGSKNTEFLTTEDLLKKLLSASIIYRKITQPQLDDWKSNRNYHIYYHIKNINGLFNLKVHFPFFLALFEEFEKGTVSLDLLNKTLLLMENFHFIFSRIVSPRASGLDNKYSKFAIKLRKESNKSKVIRELRKELKEKLPTETEYTEKFKEIDFINNKDTIKFILLRLEKIEDPSLTLDFDLNSIEHLTPKSNGHADVNTIGNLFLLEEKYNNDKGDLDPFTLIKHDGKQITVVDLLKKVTKYKTTKNDFDNIKNSGEWTIININTRTENLAKTTYKLFSKL